MSITFELPRVEAAVAWQSKVNAAVSRQILRYLRSSTIHEAGWSRHDDHPCQRANPDRDHDEDERNHAKKVERPGGAGKGEKDAQREHEQAGDLQGCPADRLRQKTVEKVESGGDEERSENIRVLKRSLRAIIKCELRRTRYCAEIAENTKEGRNDCSRHPCGSIGGYVRIPTTRLRPKPHKRWRRS